MAAQPKTDMAEDAHFRIDDLARDHAQTKEQIKGLMPAVMAIVAHEVNKQVKEAIDKYREEDKAEDRKMFQQMLDKYESGEEEITKHGTVETPDGVHKMTVTETRRRKPGAK